MTKKARKIKFLKCHICGRISSEVKCDKCGKIICMLHRTRLNDGHICEECRKTYKAKKISVD